MTTIERWRDEAGSAWLYRVVAEAESDPAKRALFRDLAAAADKQASILAADLGGAPAFAPNLRLRLIAALARLVGIRSARPLLAAAKIRGLSVYAAPPADAGHPMPRSVSDFGQEHRAGRRGNAARGRFRRQ